MKDPQEHSTILKIEGMHCASCQRPIEKALRETAGVTAVSVNLANREVSVESTVSNDELIASVAGAGFEAVLDQVQSLADDDQANKEKFRRLIVKAMVALGAGVLLMVFGMFVPVPGPEWNLAHVVWFLVTLATAAVMYYAGRHYFNGAHQSIKARSANMDTLIALGTGTAWIYSTIIVLFPSLVPEVARYVYFEAAVIIIGMVKLGQALEQRARGRTSRAIRRLLDLQQKTGQRVKVVLRRRNGCRRQATL